MSMSAWSPISSRRVEPWQPNLIRLPLFTHRPTDRKFG